MLCMATAEQAAPKAMKAPAQMLKTSIFKSGILALTTAALMATSQISAGVL
jgi:hypothetical protein